MRKILDVRSQSLGTYPVFVGDDLGAFFAQAWTTSFRQAVVIGDDNTIALFADAVEQALGPAGPGLLRLAFPPGEPHKTRETKARLEDAMLEAGIERSACVIGLGGGIALDVAGFVSATFLRGIPVMHIATSLLAQVDASVGGKTAVNTPHGKNLIGAFHPPVAVLLATGWLSSLPVDEIRNGLAELVKTAVVADPAMLAELERVGEGGPVLPSAALIERSVRLKAEVVGRDEREGGLRRILNFGHTMGHGVERASSHAISHGRAVAFGMLVEARAAEATTGFPRAECERLDRVIDRLGLIDFEPPPYERVTPFLGADKKAEGGEARYALPMHLGEMDPAGGAYARAVPPGILRDAYDKALAAVVEARTRRQP